MTDKWTYQVSIALPADGAFLDGEYRSKSGKPVRFYISGISPEGSIYDLREIHGTYMTREAAQKIADSLNQGA